MKNNTLFLSWTYEFIWILISLIFVGFFTKDLYALTEKKFFVYVSTTMFLAFNLFRWIAFPRFSPLMFSFWFKAFMLLANIFMFIYILKNFQDVMNDPSENGTYLSPVLFKPRDRIAYRG